MCFLLWRSMSMALKAVPLGYGFMGQGGTCWYQGFSLKANHAMSRKTDHRYCFCKSPVPTRGIPPCPISIAQTSTGICQHLVIGEEVSWLRVLGAGCFGVTWEGLSLVSCSATRLPGSSRTVSVSHVTGIEYPPLVLPSVTAAAWGVGCGVAVFSEQYFVGIC